MARPHAPRGQARARVIDAALELFAERGVSGTSLQTIAERLGVTKAAVYHQFPAKEDIVVAVVDDALAELSVLVEDAEQVAATDGADAGVRRLLPGLVDLTFAHRQALAALARDPEMIRIVDDHHELQSVIDRADQVLLGPDPDLRRRVAVSLVSVGLAHASVEPRLADVGEDALRAELHRLAEDLLLG